VSRSAHSTRVFASGSVEFAHDLSVGAAAREEHQAARRIGRECVGTAPDPVLAFGRGERVEIENGLPGRLRLAVFGERGAPPQAALVGFVLPEVVDVLAAPRDVRDAVFRVQDLQKALARGCVLGARLQQLLRACVLVAHPGERTIALDVFEPEEGVVVDRGVNSRGGSLGCLRHGEWGGEGKRGRKGKAAAEQGG